MEDSCRVDRADRTVLELHAMLSMKLSVGASYLYPSPLQTTSCGVDGGAAIVACVTCHPVSTPVTVRWMSLDDGASPTGLYLSSVKVGDLGLLDDSVQVRLDFPPAVHVVVFVARRVGSAVPFPL